MRLWRFGWLLLAACGGHSVCAGDTETMGEGGSAGMRAVSASTPYGCPDSS